MCQGYHNELQEQLAGALSQFQVMNSSVRMSPHIVV